jgi:hypothetical protein
MRRDNEYYVVRLQRCGGWRIREHKSFSERCRAVIRRSVNTRRVHQISRHVTIAQQVLQALEEVPRTLLGSVVSCAVQSKRHLASCQELFDEVFVEVDLFFHRFLLLFVLARLVLYSTMSVLGNLNQCEGVRTVARLLGNSCRSLTLTCETLARVNLFTTCKKFSL